jgi:hypothetical protein
MGEGTVYAWAPWRAESDFDALQAVLPGAIEKSNRTMVQMYWSRFRSRQSDWKWVYKKWHGLPEEHYYTRLERKVFASLKSYSQTKVATRQLFSAAKHMWSTQLLKYSCRQWILYADGQFMEKCRLRHLAQGSYTLKEVHLGLKCAEKWKSFSRGRISKGNGKPNLRPCGSL